MGLNEGVGSAGGAYGALEGSTLGGWRCWDHPNGEIEQPQGVAAQFIAGSPPQGVLQIGFAVPLDIVTLYYFSAVISVVILILSLTRHFLGPNLSPAAARSIGVVTLILSVWLLLTVGSTFYPTVFMGIYAGAAETVRLPSITRSP